MDVALALTTGIITGVISSIIMYFYSAYKDKTKDVVGYLQHLVSFLEDIYDIFKERNNQIELKEEEIQKVIKLTEKSGRHQRQFKYKKDEKNIHNLIKRCNEKLYDISNTIKGEEIYNIRVIISDIPDIFIDANNEIINYKRIKNKRLNKFVGVSIILIVIIISILFRIAG